MSELVFLVLMVILAAFAAALVWVIREVVERGHHDISPKTLEMLLAAGDHPLARRIGRAARAGAEAAAYELDKRAAATPNPLDDQLIAALRQLLLNVERERDHQAITTELLALRDLDGDAAPDGQPELK